MKTPLTLSVLSRNVSLPERFTSGSAGLLLASAARHCRWPIGSLLAITGAALLGRAFTGFCPVYHRLNIDGTRSGSVRHLVRGGTRVPQTPDTVYRFWREPQNLRGLSDRVVDVHSINPLRSYWKIRGPGGTIFPWHAEIIEDRPNEIIVWQSVPGSPLENAGSVRFFPDSGGTRIQLQFAYRFQSAALQLSVPGAISENLVQREIDQAWERLPLLLDSAPRARET